MKLCSAILVLFVVLTASALAAEVLYSGTCGGEGDGSNLTWTLDDEGTLRIDGNGEMGNYWNGSPWYNYRYRSSIKSAVIGEGVTSIGRAAFEDCSSLTSVTIPGGVTSIGRDAFLACSSLKDVYYPGTKEAWKKISIGSYNTPLTRATIHYNATVLTPSVTRTADGTVYKVSAANLPVSSVVVVALYKDGRFVGYESAVYNGETLEIAADTPHDTATILAWSDLEKLIPLAPGTKIGS